MKTEKGSKTRRGSGTYYVRDESNGVIWFRLWAQGRWHRWSTGTTDMKEAEAFGDKKRAEAREGKLTGSKRVTFEDLAAAIAADYELNERKSLDSVHHRFKHLRRAFGKHQAKDITDEALTAYVTQRRKQGAALATVKLELAALRRAFRLARVKDRPEFPSLSPKNVRKGFFEEPDLRAVLQHLPDELRAPVLFA